MLAMLMRIAGLCVSHASCPRVSRVAFQWSKALDNLAGIHEVLGIERALDPAHELDLDGRRVPLELRALQLTDAVVGAEASPEALRDIVDDAIRARGVLEEVARGHS